MSSRMGIAQRLEPRNRVNSKTISLQVINQSVYGSIMIDAVRHAGIDPDAPGSVEAHYLYDEKLLVLDLGGEFQDDE